MQRLWNRIDFALGSAWQNFWRNAAVSVASVLIVWVVLLALGTLLLVLHSLDQIVALEKTKASAISVYLADTTPLSSASSVKVPDGPRKPIEAVGETTPVMGGQDRAPGRLSPVTST